MELSPFLLEFKACALSAKVPKMCIMQVREDKPMTYCCFHMDTGELSLLRDTAEKVGGLHSSYCMGTEGQDEAHKFSCSHRYENPINT